MAGGGWSAAAARVWSAEVAPPSPRIGHELRPLSLSLSPPPRRDEFVTLAGRRERERER
jgi:hypothetical protein